MHRAVLPRAACKICLMKLKVRDWQFVPVILSSYGGLPHIRSFQVFNSLCLTGDRRNFKHYKIDVNTMSDCLRNLLIAQIYS